MANDERLGASFSIDVTDLKAGLSQANRMIRESESEFKAAAAGMDDWRKSEEGLTAKIKSLNDVTDIQRKKVEALQDEYNRLISEGLDPASKEAVELRTKINNETAALNKNEAEAEKLTKALDELGDEAKDAGEAAEDAGDGFTVMKGAAADLVANGVTALVEGCKTAITTLLSLGEETREYRENMSKLETSFDTANLSAEDLTTTYTDLYSIMGDEGAATEAAQSLAKVSKTEDDLSANTRILTGVMAEYGSSIPLEGLAEGIQATANMSSVQGALADALEWQGINLDDYNKKLEALSTEEERAAYIQKTLTDLYGDSADAYRETNKSVIEARKATAKYTDQMAELGEEIEPINADITEFKTELAKEFVPVVKKHVAPAMKEFTDSMKDRNIPQKFGKAIAYVVDNFETLVKVGGVALTTFVGFKAAIGISSVIQATTTAITALNTAVKAATAAQTAWNVAQSSNLIGAIGAAVGLLIGGLTVLITTQNKAKESTDLLSDRQRAAVEAAEEAAEAYRDTKEAADEMAAAGQAQLDNTEKLWGELKNLATANGEVKESDKARAEFILGELNSALGTEYSMTGNIISNYKEMVSSIEKVIETKRAQILLEAYEETYAEAVKNVAEAEKARSIQAQELVAQQEVIKQKEKELADARIKAQEHYKIGTDAQITIGNNLVSKAQENLDKEKNILETKKTKFSETDASIKGYYDNITSYETASTLVLAGETGKAIGYLNKYGSGFQTAASLAKKSKDEQLEILRDQVVNTEINLGILEAEYEQAQGNMTEEEKKQAKLRIENAKKQATDAKDEYYKVGGNMVEGMAKGAEDGEWTLSGALKKTVKKGLDAAKKALGIESPSKVFRKEVGRQIPAGEVLGIEDGTPSVVKAIKNHVNKIRGAYDLSGVAGAVNKGVAINRNNAGKTETQSGGLTVYQTNNFKQAYESPIEKYKSKQQLFAAARLIKAGAI